MTPLLRSSASPAGNGRTLESPGPEDFRGPGFRFARCFLLVIFAIFGALVLLVGALCFRLRMDVVVSGRGIARPSGCREVKAEITGLIRRIPVLHGDRVRAGQPLVVLDDSEWRTELEKAERELAVNRSRRAEIEEQMGQEREVLRAEVARAVQETEGAAVMLEQSEREYRLYYDLYPVQADGRPRPPVGDLLPLRLRRTAVERAEAEGRKAERRLEGVEGRKQEILTLARMAGKLEQDRDLLRHRLSQAVLFAPVNGTVLTGDLPRRVGDHLQAGEPVLEISDLSAWEARAMVSETDIARVRPGQEVRLYVTAFPQLEYGPLEGTVSEVPSRPEAGRDPGGSPLYPVRIAIRNPGERAGLPRLVYGMSLEARITVDRGRVASLIWKRLLKTAGKIRPRDFHLSP